MSAAKRDTGVGPTYEVVTAVYVAAVATVGVVAALVVRGASTDRLALAFVLGGTGAVAVVGLLVGTAGLPRAVHPRPLYASGLSWLPAAAGAVPALGGLAGLTVAAHTDVLAPSGVIVVALFGGLAVAGVGWLVRVMARNATARARLADADPTEWTARPGPTARRYWTAAAVGIVVAVGALAAATRRPGFLAFVGSSAAAWGQTRHERRFRLTDDALVYGGPEACYLLDRADVTGVSLADGTLRIERRGPRPALTCDATDIDDSEAVVAALTRRR